jgi:hypothetical protein
MNLIEACISNNVEEVKLLLSEGVTSDEKTHAIKVVCYNGNLEIVKLLIADETDIVTFVYDALKWAVQMKNGKVIDYLNNRILLEKLNDFS